MSWRLPKPDHARSMLQDVVARISPILGYSAQTQSISNMLRQSIKVESHCVVPRYLLWPRIASMAIAFRLQELANYAQPF